MTTFRIVGLKELEQNLDKLSRATGKNTIRRALIKGGQPAAREARRLAPRRLGDLVESIDVSPRAVPAEPKKSAVEVYLGPGRHPQAVTQEFGTWFHPSQPYLRPAWEGNKARTVDEVGFALFEEMEKSIARAARRKG